MDLPGFELDKLSGMQPKCNLACAFVSPRSQDRLMPRNLPISASVDPILHTITYVRSKSSFLFSVILEVACRYLPTPDPELFRKLSKHVDWLIQELQSHGYKSIEICQAYQIRSAWQAPTSSDERRVWQHLSLALTMAIELRLESLQPSSVSYGQDWQMSDRSRRERLIRNAQRTWLW